MHGINGYLWTDDFGTGDGEDDPLYRMSENDRVRWYVGALGSEVDLHSAHWHGMVVTDRGGHREDVPQLLPGVFRGFEMTEPDSPGKWIYHCHVEDHVAAGMTTTFTVE